MLTLIRVRFSRGQTALLPELWPGVAAPYTACAQSELADFFSVTGDTVADWLARGLPRQADDLIDLFAACNWLTWNALAEAPALAWRWQIYRDFVESFFTEADQEVSLSWDRHRHHFTDAEVTEAKWWLPRAVTNAFQQVRTDSLQNTQIAQIEGDWHVCHSETQEPLVGTCEVIVKQQRRVAGCTPALHQRVFELLEPLVAAFQYGYRFHRRSDRPSTSAGSCLDVALTAAEQLQTAGFDVALEGGVFAHPVVSNPHYWLVVREGGHTIPIST